MAAVPGVRAAASAAAPVLHATDYGVAGEAPAVYDISSISNSDLAHVIPIAILVIGVLLGLVMRSLIAPLYLIASVAKVTGGRWPIPPPSPGTAPHCLTTTAWHLADARLHDAGTCHSSKGQERDRHPTREDAIISSGHAAVGALLMVG
jgi:hypothetical protein